MVTLIVSYETAEAIMTSALEVGVDVVVDVIRMATND